MRAILSILSAATTIAAISAAAVFGQDFGTASVAAAANNSPRDNSAPAAGDASPSCIDPCTDAANWCCNPSCWTATAGTAILHRSAARPALLVENGATDQELANVADFDLGFAAGPRVELTRHFDCGWDIGAEYFSVDGWSATRSLADRGNLRVPLVSSAPADYFDTASASYDSRLYSTEINVKRQCNDWLRILAGFRWVEIHEMIDAGEFSPRLEGTIDARTHNYLYGFQLGTEASLWQRCRLSVDGFLKAGVYGGFTQLAVSGHGTNLDFDGSTNDRHPSFLGEIGLTATYRLNCHWSLTGGYEAMWIDHVALAANTVAALQQGDENLLLNGHAFYHGALAGLNCTW